VDDLAHIDVRADPADAQEGRIFAGDVLLVGIAQGFELLPEGALYLEADEERLIEQELQQAVVFHVRAFPANLPSPSATGIAEPVDESNRALVHAF